MNLSWPDMMNVAAKRAIVIANCATTRTFLRPLLRSPAPVSPLRTLSSYKPAYVLKGQKSAEGSQFFRRALVVGQFSVSIGLIICSMSVYRQLQYINNKDLGYNRFGLINIPVENRSVFNSWEALKNDPETYFPVINRADDRYLDVFEMRLLAGSDFTPAMVADTTYYYIINDAARAGFSFKAFKAG